MSTNPGLKSCFSEKLVFPDFSVEDACQLLRLQLSGQFGLELDPDVLSDELPRLVSQVSSQSLCIA